MIATPLVLHQTHLSMMSLMPYLVDHETSSTSCHIGCRIDFSSILICLVPQALMTPMWSELGLSPASQSITKKNESIHKLSKFPWRDVACLRQFPWRRPSVFLDDQQRIQCKQQEQQWATTRSSRTWMEIPKLHKTQMNYNHNPKIWVAHDDLPFQLIVKTWCSSLLVMFKVIWPHLAHSKRKIHLSTPF